MKKNIAFIAVATMILLASCGGKKNSSNPILNTDNVDDCIAAMDNKIDSVAKLTVITDSDCHRLTDGMGDMYLHIGEMKSDGLTSDQMRKLSKMTEQIQKLSMKAVPAKQ